MFWKEMYSFINYCNERLDCKYYFMSVDNKYLEFKWLDFKYMR